MSIQNALIKDTFFGFEDHGILTCWLSLDVDGCLKIFGGYSLEYYGTAFQKEILRVVGVGSWEELKGKYCRVVNGELSPIRIGHIIEDRWFDPQQLHPAEV